MCQRIGARLVWAMSNFIVFVCMAGTAVISLFAVRKYSDGIQHVIGGNGATRIAALVVFAVLGFPLSVSLLPISTSITLQCHLQKGSLCYAYDCCLAVADYI